MQLIRCEYIRRVVCMNMNGRISVLLGSRFALSKSVQKQKVKVETGRRGENHDNYN